MTLWGSAAVALLCWGGYLAFKIYRMPAVRPGVDGRESLGSGCVSPGPHRLDTASVFSVKLSTYAFLAFLWYLTLYGMSTGNPRVVPVYVLLPFSLIVWWWLSGFKQATLSGNSLIVRDSEKEAHISLESIKEVVEHPWLRGLAHVTIIFKADTQFGRKIRIKTYWSDCEDIASLVRNAVELAK